MSDEKSWAERLFNSDPEPTTKPGQRLDPVAHQDAEYARKLYDGLGQEKFIPAPTSKKGKKTTQ